MGINEGGETREMRVGGHVWIGYSPHAPTHSEEQRAHRPLWSLESAQPEEIAHALVLDCESSRGNEMISVVLRAENEDSLRAPSPDLCAQWNAGTRVLEIPRIHVYPMGDSAPDGSWLSAIFRRAGKHTSRALLEFLLHCATENTQYSSDDSASDRKGSSTPIWERVRSTVAYTQLRIMFLHALRSAVTLDASFSFARYFMAFDMLNSLLRFSMKEFATSSSIVEVLESDQRVNSGDLTFQLLKSLKSEMRLAPSYLCLDNIAFDFLSSFLWVNAINTFPPNSSNARTQSTTRNVPLWSARNNSPQTSEENVGNQYGIGDCVLLARCVAENLPHKEGPRDWIPPLNSVRFLSF